MNHNHAEPSVQATESPQSSKNLFFKKLGWAIIGAGGKLVGLGGDVAQGVGNAATGLFANLSGEEALEKIATLIEQQRRYNDVLATRLAEALGRIEELEKKIEVSPHGR